MNICHTTLPIQQRGAVTLLVSLVLLLAVTLVVIATSRATFMEQRISGNDMRAKAAFEAAQAGLNEAISLVASGDPFPVGQQALDVNMRTVGFYEIALCHPTPGTLSCANVTGCNAPIDPNHVLVFSCGWSDDQVGLQRMLQLVMRRPAVPNPPSNPMTSRGGINVSGSATVSNYFSNLTIWTGNSVDNIGNSGKTFTRNPVLPTPAIGTAPPAPPVNCSSADIDDPYICTTDNTSVGPDVIANDTSISSLTTDQFFENFFGSTPDEYQSLAEGNESIIWIDGDASLTSNTTYGTLEEPVVLIIDGDLDLGAGNITVNGILYVLGDVSLSGNFLVNGSAVVDGTVSGTGSLDVVYNPSTVGGAGGDDSLAASLAGSWRDWL